MANEISKISVGNNSVWDVQFRIKSGIIVWNDSDPVLKNHKVLLKEAGWDGTSKIRWMKSLRMLLRLFQDHIDSPTIESGFDSIDALHFLKLSLHTRGGYKYFCFQTQFYDPNQDEQEYTADMFDGYGGILEIVWRHCKDVNRVFDDSGQGALSREFLDLVKDRNVDNSRRERDRHGHMNPAILFYVKNPEVSPVNVKTWKKDSNSMVKLWALIGKADRDSRKDTPDHKAILTELLEEAAKVQNAPVVQDAN